jgi:hypothetical protein
MTTETGRPESSDHDDERSVTTLRDLEAHHIVHVLGLTAGNRAHAAHLLGVTRWSLARRLKKHGLTTAALLAVLALVVPAGATRIPGGGDPRTECYAELEVDGAASVGQLVQCTDGDPRCDADGTANDSCRFRVAVCLNQNADRPTCVPPGTLQKVKTRGAASRLEVPPLDGSTCGAFVDVEVPVKVRRGGRVRKPGKVRLPVTAYAASKPRTDRDSAILVCLPPGATPTTTSSASTCPRNPDGPNELLLTVKAEGTDLDNGWAGPSQNLPIPAGTKLQMCLASCNDSTDPTCDATINTGTGTVNGETFGPPLPVLVAGVPTCIVNEFQSPVFTGTANLETGAIDATIALHSHVYLTDLEKVCPRCLAGRCDGGARAGAKCTVDGTVFVSGSTAADKTFAVSKDCPPADDARAGTLEITLPLTTAASTLETQAGAKAQTPCVGQPRPDTCGDGECSAGACAGPQTCQRVGTDPSTGEPVCIDAKGGVSEYCCSNDPSRSCQPTRAGNPIGVVERIGHAEGPLDANAMPYGAGDYPKRSDVVMAATFCEGATGTATIDAITGLPGPGAMLLPAAAEWSRAIR